MGSTDESSSLDAGNGAKEEPTKGFESLRQWLASRTPPPPQHLAERLTEIVGAAALDAPASPNVLLDRGIETLRSALSDRDGALDLLAADALITYSMEAAANECATMDATAAEAIQRIARGSA